MHDQLVGLLDRVDAAVAESAGVLDREAVDSAGGLARDIRVRLSYPESVVVAALCGGTGSGKSSLLNAIAGEEVALTGGIRPVTSRPLALVPAPSAPAMSGYLDLIGITDRVEHHGPPWLCLIDLPDNDSVEVEHRHQVDALLPRVDVVVWVTDPEKYRDASFHHRYLAPSIPYQDQFLFVLNQVDRLDPADAAEVQADLSRALVEDGITEPEVLAMAADPVAGPPIGIDRLLAALSEVRDKREAAHGKSLADLTVAASRLVDSASGARGIDFEPRWADEVVAAVDLARNGRAAGGAHDLASFIASLAQEVGGETADRLQALAVEAHASFLGSVADLSASRPRGPHRRWRMGRRRASRPGRGGDDSARDDLINRVDEVIGDPIRELLVQRGQAHAAITELSLALGDLRRRLR